MGAKNALFVQNVGGLNVTMNNMKHFVQIGKSSKYLHINC